MSERGNFRGGGGGHRGRGSDRGGRGGGGRGGAAAGDQKERPKKENIIDLNRFMDKPLKIKFNGGREGTVDTHNASHLADLLLLMFDQLSEF